MATEAEMRQVIDEATSFILVFLRQANAPTVNESVTRVHVAGTLAFLAVETERLGMHETFDAVVRCLTAGEDQARL